MVMATVTSARITLVRIQSKIANFKAAIFEPDPKIGSSGGRSWPGTARLFPMVLACSTEWRIRHDRRDRLRGLFPFELRMKSVRPRMRRAKRERRLFAA